MNFTDIFKRQAETTESENGGKVFSTTSNELLDLFANIGGMRNRKEKDVVEMWLAARNCDKELADNLILYTRDIRNQGLGERNLGRILLRELALIDPHKIERNLQTIVDAGRWDDLYCFVGTPVEKEMWNFIELQLKLDIEGMKNREPISIMAKWLKSSNTSSEESRKLAKKTYQALGLTERTYRKTLSALRKYLRVVETLMSAGKWNEINFEEVPSVAMSRYIKTYDKHCQERFEEYKESLKKGEAKVNASVLYPYDITMKFFKGTGLDVVDEAQWNSLPNYVDGENDVVVMADVSGSMTVDHCRPIATSIGLATYFAQRNKGAYHGMYMTFTNDPHFIKINDNWSLKKTLDEVVHKGIGYSTDLDKAFEAIFEVAETSGDCPSSLIVISDMEIDRWYSGDYCDSIAQKWEKKYLEIGLKAPKLILWNVESRGGRVLAQQSERVGFVSGYGVSSFSNLMILINKSAYEAMVEILSKPQFQWK